MPGPASTITKRPATWLTNDASKVYGEADPNPLTTGSAGPFGVGVGFLAGDAVTATYSRAGGERWPARSDHGGTERRGRRARQLHGHQCRGQLHDHQAAGDMDHQRRQQTVGASDPNPLTTGNAAPLAPGSGFLPADNVSATYTRTPGETVAGNPYQITATLTAPGVALGNYTITNAGAKFYIKFLWSGSAADKRHRPSGRRAEQIQDGPDDTRQVRAPERGRHTGHSDSEPGLHAVGEPGSLRAAGDPESPQPLPPDGVPVFKLTGVEYHYNWSTKGLSSGLYRIYAHLADGEIPWVDICLTK